MNKPNTLRDYMQLLRRISNQRHERGDSDADSRYGYEELIARP